MADTETILGQTEDGRTIVYFEDAGDASYTQADNQTVTVNALSAIESVVQLDNDSGYRVASGESSLSTNTVTFPVRYYGYACPGAAGTEVCSTGFEVVGGSDLSNVTFNGIVIGH